MPFISRRLTSLATIAVVVVTMFAAMPASVAAAGGSDLVSVANTHRSARGIAPVALHAAVDRIASERGSQLAADRALGHDMEYIRDRLAQEKVCVAGLAEIVAFNTTGAYDSYGRQWMDSPPHRDIMLGTYTHAGGSRNRGSDGRYYAVMVFVKLCGTAVRSGNASGFSDLGGSAFVGDIGWLVAEGITAGCSTSRYCPREPVTRAQMASFLRRATGIPSSTVNAYMDDNSSIHEGDINGVAAARIAAGCTDTRYCPTALVTRGQMASFLVRAMHLPPVSGDWFRDDSDSIHESAINRLAAAGVTGGCASGRFCPDEPVTREQMAGFLRRAFDD